MARVSVVLGIAACVFLIAVLAGQGVEQASLWAGVLGALTAILVTVARNWPGAAWRQSEETIIYTSDKSKSMGHDFRFVGGRAWDERTRAHYGPAATAELDFVGNKREIMNIRRTNNNGKYHAILERYSYGGGDDKPALPANPAIPGKRRLRVSCEVKIIDSPHVLWFSWRSESSRSWYVRERIPVTQTFWTPVNKFSKIDSSIDCYLRIDDYHETGPTPSEVQIRRIVVAEQKSYG